MKKIIITIITGIILSIVAFAAIGGITLYIDGEVKTPDVAPQIINGRTMVPVRFIAEEFGCEVYWDDTTQSVVINRGNRYKVEVVKSEVIDDVIYITYNFTNYDFEKASALWSLTNVAYQNGVELESSWSYYGTSYYNLSKNNDKEIAPGKTIQAVTAYHLIDNSNVEFITYADYSKTIEVGKGICPAN